MKIEVSPGTYIVAVSGGVDSVVLLDILARQPDVKLVVAHFDHGIREDSAEDRELVATLSQKYGVPFEFAEGYLGAGASEATARYARYDFLRQIRKKYDADAIITAHHQDDALETMTFNVLRGTGRKGMSSLQTRDGIVRPLLGYSKKDITDYAVKRNLQWREDSTNTDEKYTRNWIRRRLLPKLSRKQKQKLRQVHMDAQTQNTEVEQIIQDQLATLVDGRGLDRQTFVRLPYAVSREVMAAWLRQNNIEFDRKLIDTVVVSVKTLPPGKKISLGDWFLSIEPDHLVLQAR